MATIHEYKVWCVTDSKWVRALAWEDDGEPSACPEHPDHAIDAAKTKLIQSIIDGIALDSHGNVKTTDMGGSAGMLPFIGPNLADPCVWFEQSSRVTEMVLKRVGPRIYSSGIPNWIDLLHGRITDEDVIAAQADYSIEVTVDGGDVFGHTPFSNVEDGDYEVDHEGGQVLFKADVDEAAEVKASFSHANGSRWTVKPSNGSIMTISRIEVQFSVHATMTDTVIFEVLGYVQDFAPHLWQGYDPPGPLPTDYLITLNFRKYKKVHDFIALANGALPVIPAAGGLKRGTSDDVIVMPWSYRELGSRVELDSAKGMEARVYLENDQPIEGEFVCITFYCGEETL